MSKMKIEIPKRYLKLQNVYMVYLIICFISLLKDITFTKSRFINQSNNKDLRNKKNHDF